MAPQRNRQTHPKTPPRSLKVATYLLLIHPPYYRVRRPKQSGSITTYRYPRVNPWYLGYARYAPRRLEAIAAIHPRLKPGYSGSGDRRLRPRDNELLDLSHFSSISSKVNGLLDLIYEKGAGISPAPGFRNNNYLILQSGRKNCPSLNSCVPTSILIQTIGP